MYQNTYVLGLTGGIASGKSSVCRRMEKLGAAIVDCDKLGKYNIDPFGTKLVWGNIDVLIFSVISQLWDGVGSWTLLMDDKNRFILYSQHHDYWWLGDKTSKCLVQLVLSIEADVSQWNIMFFAVHCGLSQGKLGW